MLPHFVQHYHGQARPESVVAGKTWRITLLTSALVRLEYAPDGQFEDRPSSFAVNRDFEVPEFTVHHANGGAEIVTDWLRIVYDGEPFSANGLSIAVTGGASEYDGVWRYGVPPRSNLGGTARTLDEADGAIPLEHGIVSQVGFAVVDDSHSPLLLDDGWYEARRGGAMDLYFFGYGLDYRQALRDFYRLTGPTPLLPRHTLGNWWSRYHAYSDAELRTLIGDFERRDLPFSILVLDMDWHLTDIPARFGSGWTGYTWNRDLFPDPRGFLKWVHEQGYEVTANVHPADGVRAFEEAYAAVCERLGVDPSTEDPVLFDPTHPEFMDAYFDVLHRRLEEDGIDFWWIDWQSGPYSRRRGIDPLWVLNHYHFLDSGRDGRRPLTFSRYAGPGSHRYPIGFSGDTLITWDSLAFQPYFTATAANIGYGWWSHDIGGHMFGYRDDELATRWLQLGVFSPVNRLHSGANRFSGKEPWKFPQPYEGVMEEALRLRARLVPYLHTMNHRASFEGIPLVVPMYHEHPRQPEAYEVPNQFLFGSELLVAPITSPASTTTRHGSVTAWLPEGTWLDVFTGLVYDGGRQVTMHRDIHSVPVLAKAGAIVPLDGAGGPGSEMPIARRDVGTNPESLELLVFAGHDGRFTLLEDDGRGTGADPAQWARTTVVLDTAEGTITVGPAEGNLEVVPARRDITLTLVGFGDPSDLRARVGGEGVDPAIDTNPTTGRTHVHLLAVPVEDAVEVRSDGLRELRQRDTESLVHELLNAAHIGYIEKALMYDIVIEDPVLAPARLQAVGADAGVLSALTEVVAARRP